MATVNFMRCLHSQKRHKLVASFPGLLQLVNKMQHTHVKISQLVTSVQTRRQQDVFALLVPSCQQVVPNLLTTCSKLDELVSSSLKLVTRLF